MDIDIAKIHGWISRKTGCSERVVRAMTATAATGLVLSEEIPFFYTLKFFSCPLPIAAGLAIGSGIGMIDGWVFKKEGSFLTRFMAGAKYPVAGLMAGCAVHFCLPAETPTRPEPQTVTQPLPHRAAP